MHIWLLGKWNVALVTVKPLTLAGLLCAVVCLVVALDYFELRISPASHFGNLAALDMPDTHVPFLVQDCAGFKPVDRTARLLCARPFTRSWAQSLCHSAIV